MVPQVLHETGKYFEDILLKIFPRYLYLLSQSCPPSPAIPLTRPSRKPSLLILAGEKEVLLSRSVSELPCRDTELKLLGTMLWPNLKQNGSL